MFGLLPFRCRACSERFYRNWKIVPPPPTLPGIAPAVPPVMSASVPSPATQNYHSVEVDPAESAPESLNVRASKPLAGFFEAWQARKWSLTVLPYWSKSFAVLLLLHYLVGTLEFRPLGKEAMWVNLLSLVTVVGTVLVFIDLYRARRASSEAVGATVGLVLRWEGLFLAAELVFGCFFGPGVRGLNSAIALFREQSPWIWMTYAELPLAGAIGCFAYLFHRKRLEA